MAGSSKTSLMPWLILGVIAVIAFGSLYPFSFDWNVAHPNLFTAFQELTWAHASHTDQLRNVLMYLPLGFCLLIWLRLTFSTTWSILLSCVIGALLSLCIEVAQVYVQRVPSFLDASLNSVGTLLGAIVGLSWGALTNWIKLPENVKSQSGDRNALLLVVMWIIWRLLDMSFHISLAHLKMALHPLLHIEISWLLVLRYLLLWSIVSLATLSYASRQRGSEALLAVIAIVVITRILFVSPLFDSSELLALLLLLPALIVIHALRWVPATIVVLLALLTLYTYDHVLPLTVGTFHFNFDFVPFVTWAKTGFSVDWSMLLHMLFVFTAMIWLLKESSLSLRTSVILVVAMLLGIEVLHLWQLERSGSITRPSIALCIGLLMMAIDRRPHS